MDTKRDAAWPRVWRWLACVVMVGVMALPGVVQASPGCMKLNGASGTLGSYGVAQLLTNDDPVNAGDTVTATTSGAGLYVGSWLQMNTGGGIPVAGVESNSGAAGDGIESLTDASITYSISCHSVGPGAPSVSPSTASTGNTVTISGTGFWGTTGVKFGSVPAANFAVITATQIIATVPAGSGTVPITVTTDGGTATGGSFAFAAPTVGPVTAQVAANSSNNPITLNITGAATSVAVATPPAHGTATPVGLSITYTPTAGYVGSDSFTYTATGSNGTSSPGVVTVAVATLPQTITFDNPGAQNFGTTPTLTATSTSGLPVQFNSETTDVCTITSGGVVTLLPTNSLPATHTCTIDANQPGSGTYSPAPQVQQSFSVQALTPSPPTIGVATAGNTQASVGFTAPATNGGAGITQYTVTSSPGGFAGSGPTSPITVTGLTNGTAYTFTVTATNSVGTSSASSSSNSVTPIGAQTITFTNPGSQNFGTSPQLLATSTSGLSVTFTSGTTNVCTVTTGGVLTTVAPGTCTIHADQAGNNAYLPAPQVTQTFLIAVPGGAVSFATPSPLPTAIGGVPYSMTVIASGGAAPYTFQLTGGILPTGMTLAPSGVLSGTPINAGTYNFTLRVTDVATQTADKNYQLVVNAPSIALTPATLPQGKVANVYPTTTFSATGGSAPYHYVVANGSLPTGLTLSPAGVLSGTPTAPGSFNVTVTATDGLGFQGSQAYTIAIGQQVPIVVNSTATTNANAAVTIPVTSQGGPITSLTLSTPPSHGTAVVNGLTVVYTPTTNYFGTDTLQYTATGPGGTSTPATVTIAVAPLAVPVAAAQAATVLAGKSITLHATTGATNGPFVSAAVVTPPSSGTAVVQGTDIVYTAALDASGTFGFDYTVSNPFGASKPAHVTLTVNPMPVAPSLAATVIAGKTVQVDLTTTAHGGPFTGAKVVSVSPSNAGSASIAASAGGYTLSFTAAPTFSGSASLSYTLSNAYAESAPGTVTVAVAPRSDPSKNAEVLGVLDAQADATRRMATGQISNFQQRLQSLHSGTDASGFSNGVTMTSASSMRDPQTLADLGNQQGMNRYRVQPDGTDAPASAPATTLQGGSLPGGVAVWTGGAINFGKMQTGASDNGIDFTTSGLSMGVDKAFSRDFAAGVGVGYGHDESDVGQNGSRSALDSYNVAFYASYHPANQVYVDALLGYQWLQFDARRYVTDDNGMVHGNRDGTQAFGSVSVGYEHQTDDLLLTPYGRLDIARAHLDGYTETGDDTYALAYQRQTVKTSTGTLGLLAQWTVKEDYGTWSPQLRAEFGHDMQGASVASMRYADLLNGPLYQATLTGESRNHTMLGAGIALQMVRGWLLRMEYQNYLDNTSSNNQSILLGVEKKFDP